LKAGFVVSIESQLFFMALSCLLVLSLILRVVEDLFLRSNPAIDDAPQPTIKTNPIEVPARLIDSFDPPEIHSFGTLMT
jgi:hypothetical protein